MSDNKKLSPEVEIRDIPEMNFAYIRHVGPFIENQELFQILFTKVFAWATPKGLVNFPSTRTLTVFHDNPDTTDADKTRISVGITVPEGTKTGGEISDMTIGGGKFAVAKFEIDPDQYKQAWDTVSEKWMPQSEFRPDMDDRLCFEVYQNDPKEQLEGKHIVEICIPVKPR